MRNTLALVLLFAAPTICVHAEARAAVDRVDMRPRGAGAAAAAVPADVAEPGEGDGTVERPDGDAAAERPGENAPDVRRASLASAAYAGIALVWIAGVGFALRRGRRARPGRKG